MKNKILLILADGFEEVEALGTLDFLRRTGFEVVSAGLNGKTVTGAHRVVVNADAPLAEAARLDFDAVVLPGGMPGSLNLRNSSEVRGIVGAYAQSGKLIAAICAAPMVLGAVGLLKNRRFTCYPGVDMGSPEYVPTGNLVETDGNIVTGKGPAAAFAFAMAIAAALGRKSEAQKVWEAMLFA